jgi:hypothetical protein
VAKNVIFQNFGRIVAALREHQNSEKARFAAQDR